MCIYKEQKYSDNKYVSNIDLGKCEEYLKLTYNIDEDLIIVITDIRNEDLTKTYVFYEIFNPINLEPFDLNECKDFPVNINIPVNLSNEIELIY